jgi:hypothetical protein
MIGEDPVGRPRTKGCSGVGLNVLILSGANVRRGRVGCERVTGILTDDVVCCVFAGSSRLVSDDDPHVDSIVDWYESEYEGKLFEFVVGERSERRERRKRGE